jgi:hypothetical protein
MIKKDNFMPGLDKCYTILEEKFAHFDASPAFQGALKTNAVLASLYALIKTNIQYEKQIGEAHFSLLRGGGEKKEYGQMHAPFMKKNSQLILHAIDSLIQNQPLDTASQELIEAYVNYLTAIEKSPKVTGEDIARRLEIVDLSAVRKLAGEKSAAIRGKLSGIVPIENNTLQKKEGKIVFAKNQVAVSFSELKSRVKNFVQFYSQTTMDETAWYDNLSHYLDIQTLLAFQILHNTIHLLENFQINKEGKVPNIENIHQRILENVIYLASSFTIKNEVDRNLAEILYTFVDYTLFTRFENKALLVMAISKKKDLQTAVSDITTQIDLYDKPAAEAAKEEAPGRAEKDEGVYFTASAQLPGAEVDEVSAVTSQVAPETFMFYGGSAAQKNRQSVYFTPQEEFQIVIDSVGGGRMVSGGAGRPASVYFTPAEAFTLATELNKNKELDIKALLVSLFEWACMQGKYNVLAFVIKKVVGGILSANESKSTLELEAETKPAKQPAPVASVNPRPSFMFPPVNEQLYTDQVATTYSAEPMNSSVAESNEHKLSC